MNLSSKEVMNKSCFYLRFFPHNERLALRMNIAIGHKDLKVFKLAYKLSMEIYKVTRGFPKEERYSLTDQILRSSRSITANIAEGYRKKMYPKMFISKMADADSELAETQVWLDYAIDCGYISQERYDELTEGYEEVGKMIGFIINHPEKFCK